MSDAELSQLKEWLTNEVKLHRYFDKLVNYRFSSIESMKNLTESDLDAVGIVPPYHRTRLLKFCESLKLDDTEHDSDSTLASTGSKATETKQEIVDAHIEDGNTLTIEPDKDLEDFTPPPLPPKKSTPKPPEPPNRESSLPRIPQASCLTGVNYDTENTIPNDTQHVKRPPPIPPRADLTEENVESSTKEANGTRTLTTTPEEQESEDTVCNNSKTDDQTDEMSSVFISKESENASLKPTPKPRRTGSSNKSQQSPLIAEVDEDNTTSQQVHERPAELPQKPTVRPLPRPRPRPPPPTRPVSFAVQPKPVEQENRTNNNQIQKGGSLNRYPVPQNDSMVDDNLLQLQPIGENSDQIDFITMIMMMTIMHVSKRYP